VKLKVFNGAAVVPNHPVKLNKAIEVQANFYPSAEVNTLATLAMKHGLPYHIEVIRKD
jgi:hypothetical protein